MSRLLHMDGLPVTRAKRAGAIYHSCASEADAIATGLGIFLLRCRHRWLITCEAVGEILLCTVMGWTPPDGI
jgi:hypothetical protein